MKLLVITPTLGTSAWLAETVASVADISTTCEHVIVAPAGMTGPLSARFPACTVIAERSGGMYAAINSGLDSVSDWDAFTYINDDDVLLADFSAVVRTLSIAGTTGPLIAYGRVRLMDGAGRRLGAIPVSPDPSLNRRLYAQRLEPVYQHGTIVTRATVDAIGGFDASLRFCGDSEFLARACVRGVRFVRSTGAEVAAFRLRAGQLTKNRAAMERERMRVDEKLELIPPRLTWTHRLARWRFRCANLHVYGERIRRHGFLSFDQLLERAS